MGLESVRTNDKYETFNGCLRDPFGTQLYLNRRRKFNHLPNGLNTHQFYCNSQIAASNLSSSNDHCSESFNYNYLWRVCRERGVLFEGIFHRIHWNKKCRPILKLFLITCTDPQFPPSNKVLFGKRESCSNFSKISSSIAWMRPFQIVSRPKFLNENNPNRRFDVELGDGSNFFLCNQSLLHATSLIYSTPKLFDRVVNSQQNFSSNSYAGIWRFRFWKFGEWIEIVIG